jgi:hypothetical protein
VVLRVVLGGWLKENESFSSVGCVFWGLVLSPGNLIESWWLDLLFDGVDNFDPKK